MRWRRRKRKYSITVFLKAVETSNLPQRSECVLSGVLAGRCCRCGTIVVDSPLTLISAVNDVICQAPLCVSVYYSLFFFRKASVFRGRSHSA